MRRDTDYRDESAYQENASYLLGLREDAADSRLEDIALKQAICLSIGHVRRNSGMTYLYRALKSVVCKECAVTIQPEEVFTSYAESCHDAPNRARCQQCLPMEKGGRAA